LYNLSFDSYDIYYREVNKFSIILSREEELELAIKYKEINCLESAKKLIVSNLKYVIKIANNYHRQYNLNRMDLIQEGNIGLMMALKKFDPYKGFRFLTFARNWIVSYIQKFIVRNISIIGTFARDKRDELFYKTNTRYKSNENSMDAPLSDIDNKNLHDVILTEVEYDKIVYNNELCNYIEEISKEFSDKYKYIIKNRILNDNPKTLQEIANHFNISRQRAHELEKTLKGKLKEKLINFI